MILEMMNLLKVKIIKLHILLGLDYLEKDIGKVLEKDYPETLFHYTIKKKDTIILNHLEIVVD